MGDPPPFVGTEMDDAAIEALLSGPGHGVLTLAEGNRGYGVPISYHYATRAQPITLGFLNVPESKKQAFANATEEVTLTVYNVQDVDAWESVIVTGTLERVDSSAVPGDVDTLFFISDPDEARRRVFDFEQFERVWYHLHISDISGRYSGPGTLE